MKIAFLGDSITLGYALEHREEDRFSAVLCRNLGHEESNFGITGTLMARAGLSASDGTSFVDRCAQMTDAEYAIVFGGTNDYFWSDTPISGGSGDAYFINALHTICQKLLTVFSRERILFLTPYPHRGVGNFAGGAHWRDSSEHNTDAVNYVGHTLSDYADEICKVSTQYGIRVLDLQTCEESFDWRIMTVDGCHPNEQGHKWLAERIAEML